MTDPENAQNNPPPGNNDDTANVSRVTIKIPPFWHESPEIWFAQIEAQFGITGTTTDISKFNTIVSSIESRILNQVSQAVLHPPENDKYKNLKDMILKEYSDTEHKKMSKLLSDMTLGDKKPSHLLNEMRRLGGANITDEFLKTLWMQRLPEQTRAIISASTGDLTALATLADKVEEVSNSGRISNINNSSQSRAAISNRNKVISTHHWNGKSTPSLKQFSHCAIERRTSNSHVHAHEREPKHNREARHQQLDQLREKILEFAGTNQPVVASAIINHISPQ